MIKKINYVEYLKEIDEINWIYDANGKYFGALRQCNDALPFSITIVYL